MIAKLLPLCWLLAVPPAAAQRIANGAVAIEPTGAEGRWTGFALQAGERVFPIRFGSLENLTARTLTAGGGALRFTGLSAEPTPRLADDSYLEVRLDGDSPYPEVRFRLHLLAFDEAAWRAAMGEAPFHLLAMGLEGAEIWHHRGWSIMTPVLDPFPMTIDKTGFPQQITSTWSRDWMYAPALAACPLPTTGLWRPATRDYIGYDFHGARLTDHTEREIGTSFCLRQAGGGKSMESFTCLVWPCASPHRTGRRYPELPAQAVCESWFRLLHSGALPAWEDPNALVQRFIWDEYREAMPAVPPCGDVSWLSAPYRLADFPAQGLPSQLISRTPADDRGWWGPNTLLIGGIGWHGAPLPDTPNEAFQTAVREQIARGGWREMHGEQVFCWRQPLEGGNVAAFGPGSETVHHVSNWTAALAVLEAYRQRPDPELKRILDGLVAYSRQVLTTRNCYPDVATAQFAWSCAPGIEFCYRYAFTFDDELGRTAFAVARSLVYRYLTMFCSDSDPGDDLDSSFLMEPNAGINWLGAACANECWINLDAMARVYCHTGDPVLAQYVYGALERWHQMYQDADAPNVAAYGNALTELYGLYDGGPIGRGRRGTFGGLWGGAEQTFWPVGGDVRVVCGEAAAMAFCDDGPSVRVAECELGDGCTAFVLAPAYEAGPAGPLDVVVTRLHRDLGGLPVTVAGQPVPAARVRRFGGRPDTLVVPGVLPGQEVRIGGGASVAGTVAQEKPRTAAMIPGASDGYVSVDLLPHLNREYWFDYDDNQSMAGWEPGLKSLYGVPFQLVEPRLAGGRLAVRDTTVPCDAVGQHLFALVGERGEGSALTVTFADGTTASADMDLAFPALRAWPPCIRWHVDWVSVPLEGKRVVSVVARGLSLFAATVAAEADLTETFAATEVKLEEQRQEARAAAYFAALRPRFEEASGQIAVLPTGSDSAVSTHPILRALGRVGLSQHIVRLTPEQYVDPTYFNNQRFRLLLYLGHEKYVQSVHVQGDGDSALRRFLRGGGTLLLLSSGPYPFYYDENEQPIGNARVAGLTLRQSWEEPPAPGYEFRLADGQDALTNVPRSFAFPAAGDRRFRPVGDATGQAEVTPWLTLFDDQGRPVGDGAAWLRFAGGELAGGQVGYVWCTLFLDPAHQAEIAGDALRYALEHARLGLAEGVATRTSVPPRLDGVLDEPDWRLAPAYALPHAFLESSGAPKQETWVRCLWDAENLYVAFEADDSDVWSEITERDGPLWEGEVVEVYLDPDGDQANYKELEVSPLGTVIDLDIATHTAIDPDRYKVWNAAGWRQGVRVDGTVARRDDTDRGWCVEMAIPFADLGVTAPRPGEVWRAQFYRIDRPAEGGPEFSSWSATPDFHIPDRFGRLRFVTGAGVDGVSDLAAQTGWRIERGEWSVAEGVLTGRDCIIDDWYPHGLRLSTPPLRDVRFSCEFQNESNGGDHRDGLWIGLRSDGQSGYSVNLGRNTIQLHKYSQGRHTDDTTQLGSAAYPLDRAWHRLEILLEHDTLAVILDGHVLLTAEDRALLGVSPPEPGTIVLSARRWAQSQGSTVVRLRALRLEVVP